MYFKQYMIESDNVIYIIWQAESGKYYQSTLGKGYEQYQQHIEIESL